MSADGEREDDRSRTASPAGECCGEEEKPERAIERRPYKEGEFGATLIPDAVIVPCLDLEAIVSGGEVCVVGRAAGTGVSPLLVEASPCDSDIARERVRRS